MRNYNFKDYVKSLLKNRSHYKSVTIPKEPNMIKALKDIIILNLQNTTQGHNKQAEIGTYP